MPQAVYEVRLDLDRDSTFAADLTPYVLRMTWTNGMSGSYDEVAPPARLELALDNRGGGFWPGGSGAFAGLAPGAQVRVRASFGALTGQTLYLGAVAELRPIPGARGPQQVTLLCDDLSPRLFAADYLPPLQLDAAVDAALAALFNAGLIALPYERAFWLLGLAGSSELGAATVLFDASGFTAFDAGRTRLAVIGDPLRPDEQTAGAFVRDLLAAEGGGRLFCDARSGQYTFHNRHRDALNETLFAALDAGDLDRADARWADDVATRVTVRFRPRAVGAPGSLLWSADNLPLRLAPGQQRAVIARWRDPAQPAARVGSLSALPPVPGLDYAAAEKADGTGRSLTGSIIVSAAFSAGGAVLTLTSSARSDAYITLLRLRGTPLTAYDQQAVTVASAQAARDAGERPRLLDIPALSSAEDAAALAEYVLARFQTPLTRLASVGFSASKSAARMARALAATIGSRVRISGVGSAGSADYIVVGERHAVTAGGEHTHDVTWVLKPVERETLWVLGVAGKSELGATSRLAF